MPRRKIRRNTFCHNIYTTCNNPADVCECQRVSGVCDACVMSRVSSRALSHDLIQRIPFFPSSFFSRFLCLWPHVSTCQEGGMKLAVASCTTSEGFPQRHYIYFIPSQAELPKSCCVFVCSRASTPPMKTRTSQKLVRLCCGPDTASEVVRGWREKPHDLNKHKA